MPIEIISARGAGITPWLPALARLRIDVFREFPYLYQGSDDYERNYLQTYVRSPGSIAVLALDAGKVIGAATGLPLADEDDAFKRAFLEQGLNVSDVFYCAESVLLPGYRGKGLYRQFFAGREQQARTLPGIKWLAFCAVQRPLDHPLRPTDYLITTDTKL